MKSKSVQSLNHCFSLIQSMNYKKKAHGSNNNIERKGREGQIIKS